MTSETRAVVEAVLTALSIPHAATTGGEEARQKVLAERTMRTVVALRAVRDGGPVAWHLEWLRSMVADCPAVRYVTAEQARERVAAGLSWSEAVTVVEPSGR